MKKYLNLSVSGIVSVLTFILFALPVLIGEMGTLNGYEFINFQAGIDYVTCFSVFGFVQLILCVIIFLVAILEFLYKLNILKSQLNLSNILKILIYITAGCNLVCLISTIIAASNLPVMGIGVGVILSTILYAFAVISTFIFKDEN